MKGTFASNFKLKVTIAIAVLISCTYADIPCSIEMSVNVTSGVIFKNGSILHENVLYPPTFTFLIQDGESIHTRGCICVFKTCLWKCCMFGQAMVGKQCSYSLDDLVLNFNPPVYSLDERISDFNVNEKFHILTGDPCTNGRYALNPYSQERNPEEMFYLQTNGHLHMPGINNPNESYNFNQMKYCMDAFPRDPNGNPSDPSSSWSTQYLVLVCFEQSAETQDDLIYSLFPIGMIISIPFLLATFLVYAFIPELRNLHGKALMSYVTGLMIAYTFLATIQISASNGSNNMTMGTCLFMAFTIYFFFMVSFFWLNVMCFDIWWTFSGFRAPRQGRRMAERRRFILYCLYAWGLPMLLTGVCALMQFHQGIPKHHVRPQFGTDKCWFFERQAELVYFYLPVIILVVINLVLFGSTTYKILQINRETAMLKTGDSSRHDQYNKDKQRFNLYLKLFLVMGINWVAEWVSWAVGGSKYFWIITDFSNTMLGLFIFIIFVWKKKIKNLLIKRYRHLRYGSTASTGRTSSRFRSANVASTSLQETEKSFLSQDETALRMNQIK